MNDERKYLLGKIVSMDFFDMKVLLSDIVENADHNMLNFIKDNIESRNIETDPEIGIMRAATVMNTLKSSLNKSTVDVILSDLSKMNAEEFLYLKELINMKK